MANLCDDMLEDIVSRSSVKTILRFKAVSKRWLSDILVLPRLKSAPTMSGFFYSITRQPASIMPVEIDYKSVMFPPDRITLPSLYLPLDCIRILDTCNGLVLYMQQFWEIYYVCNPITQALVMLPKPPLAGDFVVQGLIFAVKLVFDPRVSHEFKVIRFSFSRIISGIHLEIFSSETEKWVELMIPCDSDTLEWFPYFEQSVNFVQGALYLSILPVTLLKIDVEGCYSWLVKFPSDSFFLNSHAWERWGRTST
ncbi:F-box protein [Acorus calamus]|uniref:F-box protein n=1 Tax=Acorus calamus TaxID=4465 RepID=A0AAV9E6V8_ACOCL|nr:F-box protein [Acorus calamus]